MPHKSSDALWMSFIKLCYCCSDAILNNEKAPWMVRRCAGGTTQLCARCSYGDIFRSCGRINDPEQPRNEHCGMIVFSQLLSFRSRVNF